MVKLQFEEILQHLGEFGLYQRLLYAVSCFAAAIGALHALAGLYVLHVPQHRCRVPALGPADEWDANATVVRRFVPPAADCDAGAECFDACSLFVNGTNRTAACTHGWVYDSSEFIATFATKNNLVCSAHLQLLLTLGSQSFYFGLLAGSFFVGVLSDRFGRRPVLIGSLLAQSAAGGASGLVSVVPEFLVCRFLCGLAGSGVFPTAFVLGVEFIGASKRLHAGLVIEYVYAVSLVALALGASLLRHWRWLLVAQCCVALPSLLLICLLPESPRWLATAGRRAEAEQIIRRAAQINKVQLPDNWELAAPQEQKEETKENIISIVRYPRVLGLCANIVFHWFVISVVYLGLSYNAGALPGDIYTASALNAVAEGVGYGIAHLSLSLFGRRWPHCGSMAACSLLLAGSVLLEAAGPQLDWLLLALALLGKLGISAAFGIVYLWSAELAPTSLRQSVVGCALVASRIGFVLGPLATDLSRLTNSPLGDALPLLLFAVLSAVAAATTLLLPETRGLQLPETLADGDELARSVRPGCCGRSPRVTPVDSGERGAS